MDLGQFHPLIDSHSKGKDFEKRSATWRLAPEESFSDWTIEIKVEAERNTVVDPERDSPSSTISQSTTVAVYHVHMTNLGCGSRSSQYFAKLFQTQFAESSAHKSTIVLPKSAATHFPIMLDFVYEGTLENVNSASSAAAMRFLANYFFIEDLFHQVNTTFISKNLTSETCLAYLEESLAYQDKSLSKAAVECFAEAIFHGTTQWDDSMAQLPLAVIVLMAHHRVKPPQRTKSKHRGRFSSFVLKYINSDRTRQTKEDVLVLTKSFSSFALRNHDPFEVFDIAEYYTLPMDHPLRCIPAQKIASTWQNRQYLQGRAGDDVESTNYASLSDAQKVKILELSLQTASTELGRLELSLQTANAGLDSFKETTFDDSSGMGRQKRDRSGKFTSNRERLLFDYDSLSDID